MVTESLKEVEKKVEEACKRAGRERSEVTLIAVSKTKPVEMLQEVYDTGVRDFGENKVQEMMDKYEVMPKDIHWHMLGHLQRNKVKYLMGKVALIHSVDSLRLAQEISAQSVKHEVTTDILIEVNIAGEASKFGTTREEAIALVEAAAKLPNIHICGLMTIAPYVENPEDNRKYFQQIRQLSVDIKRKNIDNVDMHVLSMGMSGDYEVAIEEGDFITMAMMDKFLNMMRLNSEEEDDFYDDDYYDEEDDYYEEPKRKSFRREKEEDTTARFATTKESKSAVKSNSKVTPMRQVKKNQGGNAAMEVCVIKPTSVEDAREITETLLNNRTVVLNLEGLDLEIGQRIIDFTSGSGFAIDGNLQKISNFIFIVTPAAVDISGDFQSIMDAFDVSSLQNDI